MELLLNIPIRGSITLSVLVLSLQLHIENKKYLSNILTVFSYRGIHTLQHQHNIMLNLVSMSISKLYNNCITNPQKLRNLSRTSFSDRMQ